jgi:hypothetical protein
VPLAGPVTAATIAPGFSTLKKKIYFPSKGGKSAAGDPLTTPEQIDARLRDVTSGGTWTPSPEATAAYRLLNAIGAISMQNAVISDQPAVTIAQIGDLLAESRAAGLGMCPELETLYADRLIGGDGAGGVLVLGPPRKRDKHAQRKYLGWDRGPVAGLPYLKRGELMRHVEQLHARLLASGFPPGAGFPDDITAQFERDRDHGQVCLPWWAWETLANLSLPAGKHPVSGRTVANRVAELVEDGRLVMTRAPRTRLTGGTWVTTSAAYAAPRPGLAGVAQRMRARIRRALTPEERARRPTDAWRELAERWRFRDAENGWGPW